MANKRGQEGMSTTAVVGIILAIAVLVVLMLFLFLGKERVFPFFFSSNNVESIKTNCAAACATNNVYSYCTALRTLKAEDLPGGIKEIEKTCNFFSNPINSAVYGKYQIAPCSAITCSV